MTDAPERRGDTAPVRLSELEDDTLPFLRLPATAEWSIDEYASICAELSVHPERRVEILARYHVDGDVAWRRLRTEWERELENPDVREVWQARYAALRRWVLRQKT